MRIQIKATREISANIITVPENLDRLPNYITGLALFRSEDNSSMFAPFHMDLIPEVGFNREGKVVLYVTNKNPQYYEPAILNHEEEIERIFEQYIKSATLSADERAIARLKCGGRNLEKDLIIFANCYYQMFRLGNQSYLTSLLKEGESEAVKNFKRNRPTNNNWLYKPDEK